MQDYVNELVNDFREPNQTPPVQRYQIAVLRRKQDATYWLGLISFDEGEYATAEEYFKNLVLDVWPEGPWTDGATYNLARTYEASGRIDEAIKIYEADDSAQRHGNRLRARWIKEAKSEEKKSEETKSTEETSTEKKLDAPKANAPDKSDPAKGAKPRRIKIDGRRWSPQRRGDRTGFRHLSYRPIIFAMMKMMNAPKSPPPPSK